MFVTHIFSTNSRRSWLTMGLHDYLVSLVFDSSYSNDDVTLTLVYGGLIFTTIQFIVTVVIPAPYGRYAKDAPSITKCKQCQTIFHKFKHNLWQIRVRGQHQVCLGGPGVPRLHLAISDDRWELGLHQLHAEMRSDAVHDPLLPAQLRLPVPAPIQLEHHAIRAVHLRMRILLIQRVLAGARRHLRRKQPRGRRDVFSKVYVRWVVTLTWPLKRLLIPTVFS